MDSLSRREFGRRSRSIPLLAAGMQAVAADHPLHATEVPKADASREARKAGTFSYCLNTSTIRGQKLTIVQEIDIAARAGYDAIEPWVGELEQFAAEGGSLDDLSKRIKDAGLVVASAIGFFDWLVDDEAQRRRGFDSARKGMEIVRRIGGTRIAAPPTGATKEGGIDLRRIAERYRKLLEVGDSIGVVPQVEIWGFSKTLGKLSETAFVAIEADHPRACILPDVYHLHRGGSGFSGLGLLGKNAIHVFHINDYPANPAAPELTDADRVFPGDGVAPLGKILADLRSTGGHVALSLETFNRDYWSQDALTVAQSGNRKMRSLVEASGR